MYLFSVKSGRRTSNTFIALFLIFTSINMGLSLTEGSFDGKLANLYTFLMLTAFVIPSALYLHIRTALDPNFRIGLKHALHLVPFIALNILIIPSVYLENLKENPIETEFHALLGIVAYLCWYILLFSYSIFSFIQLYQHKKLYLEQSSDTTIVRFNYLYQLNTITLVVFIFSAIKNILIHNTDGLFANIAFHVVVLSMLILFCWIIYKGLNSPELYKSDEERIPLSKDIAKKKETLVSSNLENQSSSDEIDKMAHRVKLLMKSKEPYLDPSLSLHDLAKQSEIPIRELSVLINHHLKKHFFDFVNEYRINKAAELLTSIERKDHTVLEILYEVGFNSKSSFNTAFKKHLKLTPTQYRQTYRKSAS